MATAPQNRPPAEFIDKHMIANVEGVMIHEYLQRTPGVVPSKAQLGAFVASLSGDDILRIVRGHPSMRSLAANIRDDDDVLRWAAALK